MCRKRLVLCLQIYYPLECPATSHQEPCSSPDCIPLLSLEKRHKEIVSKRKRPEADKGLEKLRKRKDNLPLRTRDTDVEEVIEQLFSKSTTRVNADLPSSDEERWAH
jgi:hypothetical protein